MNESLNDYYSLLELIDKIGKDGVVDLVHKGKPRRFTKGDKIYFLKADVHNIIGKSLDNNQQEEDDVIIDDDISDSNNVDMQSNRNKLPNVIFLETFIKRHEMSYDAEIYRDKPLDMNNIIWYGRSKGDVRQQKEFQQCKIISSVHGKIYMDDEGNVLYENLGANKSKVRSCVDKSYIVINADEIVILFPNDLLQNVSQHPQGLTASIKLGFQTKPNYIIRITAKAITSNESYAEFNR